MERSIIIIVILMQIKCLVVAQDQFTNTGNFELHTGASVAFLGDFINNGLFTQNGGTVVFNGTTAQAISGSATTVFNNLSVTNTTGTVSNNGTVNLISEMVMGANSTFDADGAGTGIFTLVSTSGTSTARVDVIPASASITGNLTAQRFFDGGGEVWRNFGTCVNGATVAQITTAGFTINGNDLAYYDETTAGNVDNGWVLQSTFGSSIVNSRGYSMWTRVEELTATINFTGTLNQGNQSMPITYTDTGSPTDDGWNQVNNPLPSTIDWDLTTRNGSVNGTVAVWNTSTLVYDYWNGSGNLTDGFIASGQAFWVQTNAAGPTLTIAESAKVANTTSFLRPNAEPITNRLVINLEQGSKVDRAYIHFREDATDGFDNQLDGRKLRNGIFNLSTVAGNEIMAINALPISDCSKAVALSITNIAAGEYNLAFSDILSFNDWYDFTLQDNYLNTSTLIEEGSNYNFSVTSDTSSFGASRFSIELEAKPVITSVEFIETDPCDMSANLVITNAQLGSTYTLSQQGLEIYSSVATSNNLLIPLSDATVPVGLNSFDVTINLHECSIIDLPAAIVIERKETQEIQSVLNGTNCGPGEVILSAQGASGSAYYNWHETIDATAPISDENNNTIITPIINSTTSYYVSIVNESGCESLVRVEVIAEIINLNQPDIRIIDDSVSTSAIAERYQWYLYDSLLEGKTKNALLINSSGSYSVQIFDRGCSSVSKSIIAQITGLQDSELVGITIYPNPVDHWVHINSDKLAISNISLFNLSGTLLYTSDNPFLDKIDMSTFSSGSFILQIKTRDTTFNFQIIKH
jgi:hypothetical protein